MTRVVTHLTSANDCTSPFLYWYHINVPVRNFKFFQSLPHFVGCGFARVGLLQQYGAFKGGMGTKKILH